MNTEERIKKIIVEQLVVSPEIVVPSADLGEDLGADSLDLVELIMAVEDAFDIEIADEIAEKVTTVKGIVDALANMGVK